MANKYLIVVDMQNDFVTGSLGTEEAVKIVDAVVKKVNGFDGQILFTKDTHEENYLDTMEGKLLPVKHCIEGTDGWDLVPELKGIQEKNGFQVYKKYTFGSQKLAEKLQKINDSNPIESVELIGLCTDICVVSNALLLKAFMPEVPICVDAACCAGVTVEKHQAALATMESCQITLENWK